MKKIILFLLINTFFISQYPILAIDGHRLHNYLRSKDKWVQSSGLTYLEGVSKGLGKALNILARSNTLKNELSTVLSTKYKYDLKNDKVLISERQIIIFEQAAKVIQNIEELLQKNIGMDAGEFILSPRMGWSLPVTLRGI